MAKILVVKIEYQDELRKIPATTVKTDGGRLRAFDGDNQVADFSLGKVEHWSLEDSGISDAATGEAAMFRAESA